MCACSWAVKAKRYGDCKRGNILFSERLPTHLHVVNQIKQRVNKSVVLKMQSLKSERINTYKLLPM